MTVIPPSSDSFSEQYKELLRRSGSIQSGNANAPFSGGTNSKPEGEDLGFLGRAIDFISALEYGVTNLAMKGLQLPEKMQAIGERKKAGEKITVGDELAPLGDIIAAPFTGVWAGLTGGATENKPLGADLIEQTIDTINFNNPNYVDTEDNVNPVAKGVLGFGLDVGLDPLTYVGPAAIAKGFGMAGRLGKKAVKATQAGAEGAVAGAKAAKEAATAGKTFSESLQEAGAVGKQAIKDRMTNVGEAIKAIDSPAQAVLKSENRIQSALESGVAPKKAFTSELKDRILSKKYTSGKRENLYLASAASKWLKKNMADLEVFDIPVPGKLLDEDEWVTAISDVADKGVLKTIAMPTNEIAGVKFDGTMQGFFDEAKLLEETDPVKYKQWYSDNFEEIVKYIEPLYDKYATAAKANPGVNLIGDIPTGRNVTGAAAALARLAQMSDKQFENVKNIWGVQLANQFRKMQPEQFAEFADNAQKILDKNGVAESVGKISGNDPERLLLNRFGVSVDEYRKYVDDMDARIGELVQGQVAADIAEFGDELGSNGSLKEYVTGVTRGLDSPNREFRFNRAMVANDMLDGIVKVGKSVFNKLNTKVSNPKNKPLTKDGKVRKVDPANTSYGTDEQLDGWVKLSMDWGKKFSGTQKRDEFNTIIKKYVNGSQFVEYLEDPRYIQAIKEGNPVAYFGFELAELLEETVVNSSRILDDLAGSQGLAVTLSHKIGNETITETLRLSDVYNILKIQLRDTLGENGTRMLRATQFNGTTGVPISLLSEAAFLTRTKAANSLTRDELIAEVVKTLKRGDKGSNWFSEGLPNRFGFRPKSGKGKLTPVPEHGLTWEAKYYKKDIVGHWAKWDPEVVVQRLAESIVDSRGMFDEVIELRKAQHGTRSLVDYQMLAPSVAAKLVDLFVNPAMEGESILAINNLGTMIGDYNNAIKGTEIAEVYSAGALQAVLPQQVRYAARSAEEITAAVKSGDSAKVTEAKQAAVNRDDADLKDIKAKAEAATTEEAIQAADPELQYGLYEDGITIKEAALSEALEVPADAGIRYTVMRFLRPLIGDWGMNAINHPKTWNDFRAMGIAARKRGVEIEKKIVNLIEKYPGFVDGEKTYLQVAFKNLQDKVDPETVADDLIKAAMKDLKEALDEVVISENSLRTALASTTFGRAGVTLDKLNKLLEKHAVLGVQPGTKMAKLPESGSFIDISKAVADSKELGVDELTAALLQWRDWKVDNPLEFIAGMHGAMFDLANEAAFIDRFYNYTKKLDWATTNPLKAKKLGFVRMAPGDKSHFGDMLPSNMYLHPEAAEMLKAFDLNLRTSRTLTSDLGKFVMNYIDPITQKLKYTMTVIRPGHHIRNEIGNVTMQFITLGVSKFKKSQDIAWQAMRKFSNQYTDVNIDKAIIDGGELIADDGLAVVSFKFGKKRETLTLKQISQLAEYYLLDTGKIAEDIFNEAGNVGFTKFVENVGRGVTFGFGAQGGTFEKLAFGASEFIEHKARIATFAQALLQMADGKPIVTGIGRVAKPKNMEEAIHYAMRLSVKAHPNAATLAPMESRYGRRIFLFYSWIKQASVQMAENSVMHPARTWTLFPKASYNLAVAMGINPESRGNPFPTDQLFPSYFREDTLGPQFKIGDKYVAMSPGIVSVDLFDQLLANPMEGLVSGVNPLYRVPIELLAGSRLGSQAPIRDISDYIDSSIPGLGYASNFTGRSFVTLGIQEQAKVATGAKTGFDQFLSAANYFSGLGFRNYSRQDMINYAEIEARNAAAQEAKK